MGRRVLGSPLATGRPGHLRRILAAMGGDRGKRSTGQLGDPRGRQARGDLVAR